MSYDRRQAANPEENARKADQDYKAKQAEIQKLLGELDARLKRHEKKRQTGPLNWGYNGDLGHVIEVLKDLKEGWTD